MHDQPRALPSHNVATARLYARCRHQAFTVERLRQIVEIVGRLSPSKQRIVVLGDGSWSEPLSPREFARFVDDVASWPRNGALTFATGGTADSVTFQYVGSSSHFPKEAAAVDVTFAAGRMLNNLDACVAWFALLAQAVPDVSSGTLALSTRVTLETLPALYENPGLDVSEPACVRKTLCVDMERAAGVACCTYLSSSLINRCLGSGSPHGALTLMPCGDGAVLRAPPGAMLAHDDDTAAPLLALGAALGRHDALHVPGERYGTWVLHGPDGNAAQHAAIERYHCRFVSPEHLAAFRGDADAARTLLAEWQLRQQSTSKPIVG